MSHRPETSQAVKAIHESQGRSLFIGHLAKALTRRLPGRWLSLMLLFAGVVGPMPAMAGPPYATDDPEPADYHSWEVYTVSQYANGGGVVNGALSGLDVNFGIARNAHVTVGIPLAYSRTSGDGGRSGMGDLQLGVKYRFLEESATRPEVAVYPSASLPTGNGQTGLGLGHPQTFLPIWAQKSAGPWTLFGGGGLHLNPGAGNRNWWYGGATLTRKVTPQISVGAEVYHTTADALGKDDSTGFNLGFVRSIDERHALLLSAGRAMNVANAFSAYAAYEIRFLPRAKRDP